MYGKEIYVKYIYIYKEEILVNFNKEKRCLFY